MLGADAGVSGRPGSPDVQQLDAGDGADAATRPAAESFADVVGSGSPWRRTCWKAIFGTRNTQRAIGQRERLLALGSLSAGLTHELNNPAAAAVRATATLRERVGRMRHKLSLIAQGTYSREALASLIEIQERTAERVAKAPVL
ncbi:hypothetical protein SMICM17S_12422 [Streptomyces microflavus]